MMLFEINIHIFKSSRAVVSLRSAAGGALRCVCVCLIIFWGQMYPELS